MVHEIDDEKEGHSNNSVVAEAREIHVTHSASFDTTARDPPLFQFLTGIKEDLRARLPLYADDWGRPKNVFTVINASVFCFVCQLIPALIFAELLDRVTEGNLATAEVLLSAAIIGIIYALFAGQPLVIMGITGPLSILLGTSYGLTKKFEAEYFPFFFWICIWAGLFHMISAMVGLVSLVWKVTPFTTQVFELFSAITFIYSSFRDLVEPIRFADDAVRDDRSQQYAAFLIGAITCYTAFSLHFAETWVYFNRQVRTVLTSYNTLIAVVLGTALSYLPGVDLSRHGQVGLDRVSIRFAPWDWQPTVDRNWVIHPFKGIDARGILGAMIPGLMVFLLFIIDHNVSSILTQNPKLNLKKPPAYHLDFFVLGLTFIPCAVMGLPPGNGLLPQAPLHARALCTRIYRVDEKGVRHEVVIHCEEQRWSGLAQACLMFVALSMFEVISWIPRGCLFGLFLYLGLSMLHGNEVWERVLMNFISAKRRPTIPIIRDIPWRTVRWWTAIQVICAVVIFAVGQFTSVGYLYPALLTILVPFRAFVLEHFFEPNHLRYLDPCNESNEVYHEEQKEIRKAFRSSSFDSEDNEFPHFGEFRGQGREQQRTAAILTHRSVPPRVSCDEAMIVPDLIVSPEDDAAPH